MVPLSCRIIFSECEALLPLSLIQSTPPRDDGSSKEIRRDKVRPVSDWCLAVNLCVSTNAPLYQSTDYSVSMLWIIVGRVSLVFILYETGKGFQCEGHDRLDGNEDRVTDSNMCNACRRFQVSGTHWKVKSAVVFKVIEFVFVGFSNALLILISNL